MHMFDMVGVRFARATILHRSDYLISLKFILLFTALFFFITSSPNRTLGHLIIYSLFSLVIAIFLLYYFFFLFKQ